jgi:hypothetical protein
MQSKLPVKNKTQRFYLIRPIFMYNLFQNQKSTNTAFYLENTTDNVVNFCF